MLTDIRHDDTGHRFTLPTPHGAAVLEYHWNADGAMDMHRTYVPDADRRRGLAGELVRHALEFARDRRVRVVPSCWYVRRYLDRHPEYAGLVAE